MINNLHDLHLAVFGHNEVEDDETRMSRIKRSTYKCTDCGAWVEFYDSGVSVGSIVEGVDHGTESHALLYPFEFEKFWEALEDVEAEAEEIWNSTHGCDDCYPEFEEDRSINPECKTCEGEGVVI